MYIKKYMNLTNVQYAEGTIKKDKSVLEDALSILRKNEDIIEIKDMYEVEISHKSAEEWELKHKISIKFKVFDKYVFDGYLYVTFDADDKPSTLVNNILSSMKQISKEYQVYEDNSKSFWKNISDLLDDLDLDK